MKFGIIQFPGSNCDSDCYHAVTRVCGQTAQWLWHEARSVESVDAVILPGGFSYGDYLRTGAMASRAPILQAVWNFAERGGLVLGICNGFQILCEAGLLPGVLMRNRGLQFICEESPLEVVQNDTPFTGRYKIGETIQLPIAHGDGNYFIEEAGLKRLEANRQIIFRYRNNPNGSLGNIAGICNEKRNVLGLMPHPERASEALLGGTDGLKLFQSMIATLSLRGA